MMSVVDTQQRLLQLFRDRLQIEVTDASTDLVAEGLLDSLVFIDLIMLLEGEFQAEISIADIDIEQFRSVGQIVEYLGLGGSQSESVA